MNWLVVLPLEVTAGLKILQFWEHSGSFQIPEAASVTIFLVVGNNPELFTRAPPLTLHRSFLGSICAVYAHMGSQNLERLLSKLQQSMDSCK